MIGNRLEQRLRDLMRDRRAREGGTPVTGDSRTGVAEMTESADERDPGAAVSPVARPRPDQSAMCRAADTLDGDVLETPYGMVVRVERFYPLDHAHGLVSIGELAGPTMAGVPELALLGVPPEPSEAVPRPLVFVDLETTGLAGGAGTYAFLVGCGHFETHGFRIQQFFLPGFQHERSQLAAVESLIRTAAALVSYNGRTFDVPVLETRYLFHRLSPPFAGIGHLDMLHPARRFWRGMPAAPGAWPETESCRLTTLERALFGVRRIGDVPGFEIPGRYFQFVRQGDASGLAPVFEHNRLDLLSLACLTARALRLLAEAPTGARSARESCGAGRLFERAGRLAAAEASYRDAAERARRERGGDASAVRAEALQALALLCRRGRRFDAAALAWQEIVADRTAPPRLHRQALESLAIHYEHRRRDLSQARRFAQLSLAARVGLRSMADGRHRLARLDRKLWKEEQGPVAQGPLLPQI